MFGPSSSSNVTILLNVYDLNQNNNSLHAMGIGIHHTGIEINGYEFTFTQSSGIIRTRTRLPEFGTFREQITIGIYPNGMSGIYNIISNFRNNEFRIGNYHITNLNCNHFSDAFCIAALNIHIPNWINRAARIGSNFSSTSNNNINNNYNNNADILIAPGIVSPPKDVLKHVDNRSTTTNTNNDVMNKNESFSIFNWFGWTSSSTDTTTKSSNGNIPKETTKVHIDSNKKTLTDKQKDMLANLKNK